MTTGRTLLVAFALLCPVPAWAHPHLKRSEPAAGSRGGPPGAITLWFSERPEIGLTSASLKDGNGKVLPLGGGRLATRDPLEVSFNVPSTLSAGAYTVTWRTIGSDGH